jgi:hypothetical protein
MPKIEVKVLLTKNGFVLLVFKFREMWYGLAKELKGNKRIRSFWSVKKILGKRNLSVGIKDKRLDYILTEKNMEHVLWETKIEVKQRELARTISDGNSQSINLKLKLRNESGWRMFGL